MAELTISGPDDGVILVELDRPPHNNWSTQLATRFIELVRNPPEGAHILRLRALGDAFCLGRDRDATTPAELRAVAEQLTAQQRAMRETRLVTVAEVTGDAAGFGVGLAAGCDVVVATANAHFSFPEVEIGLAPSVVLTWLPKVVGEREAFWLTASGERISAARAERLGLVNAVVPDVQALQREVDRRIAILRKHRPRVHGEIRELIRVMAGVDIERALDVSVDKLVVGSLRTGDTA